MKVRVRIRVRFVETFLHPLNIPAPYEHPCVLQTVMYNLIILATLKHPL